MRGRLDSLAGPALLAFGAASAWISLGTMAVVDRSGARIGALPPWWLLIAGVLAAAALGRRWRAVPSTWWPLTLTALVWLPWLPGRVPAAFLIWTGATEGIVWAAALAGVAAAASVDRAGSSRLAALTTNPRRAPLLATVIGAVCAVTGAAAVGDRVPAGDEPHYLIITQSLLLDGDLQIENNHARADYLPYAASLPKPDYLRRGVNGEIYSVHAPGLAALVAPAFAVAGYPGVVMFLALLTAAGAAMAWHAAWLLTRSAAAAWFGWAAIFFSTPVFFHTFTVYPDSAGAACAMAGVWLLVRLELDAARVSPRALVLGAGALALLPWLHSRFVIVAAGLGAAILVRLVTGPGPRLRRALVFAAVPAIAAAAWFGYFRVIYGTFDPAAPYGGLVQNRWATLAPGLPGLLFDQQFGLIATAPIFAMAFVGLVPLARRHLRLVVELVVVALPYVLTVASFMMWWAGHSAPARFLAILLLPAVLSVSWLFHETRAVWARAGMTAAAIVGVIFTALRAGVHAGGLLYNTRDGYDLLLDWLAPVVDLPLAFPSFHRDAPMTAGIDTLSWTVALGAALGVVWWVTRGGTREDARGGLTRGTIWTIGGGALAVASMLAVTAAWQRYPAGERLTPSTSELAFLRAWNPSWHPLGLRIDTFHRLGPPDLLALMDLETTTRGGPARADGPLLSLPLVPAGDYEILVSAPVPAGTLEISVGRTSQVIARVAIDPQAPERLPVLSLPVLVHSVTVRGRDMAARPRVDLRPRSVRPPAARLTGGFALTAAQYGATRVFFMDRRSYMEPGGFWTLGDAESRVVVEAPASGGPSLVLRAGAVPTHVSLASGAWRVAYDLQAGQAVPLEVPLEGDSPALLSIASDAGFRPSRVEPGSPDNRYLGVRVEARP